MGIVGLNNQVIATLDLNDIQLIETVPGEITPVLSDKAKGLLYLIGKAMGFEEICFIEFDGGARALLEHYTNFRVKTKGRPEEFNRKFKEGFVKRVNKSLLEYNILAD